MFRKAEFWVQKIFHQNFHNNIRYLNRPTIPVIFTFAKILYCIFRHLASRREKKRTFARFLVFIIISDTYKFRPLHSLTWHSDGTSFFWFFSYTLFFWKKNFFKNFFPIECNKSIFRNYHALISETLRESVVVTRYGSGRIKTLQNKKPYLCSTIGFFRPSP